MQFLQYLCTQIFDKNEDEGMGSQQANIVFDFGGVLMLHDRQGCMQALRRLMSDQYISDVLGYGCNRPDSLMQRFELGQCSAREFVDRVLTHCQPGTTEQQFIQAWNMIHAGIPDSTWELLENLRNRGFRLFLMSNTDDIHWQHTLSLYGDRIERLFDQVFLSFEYGLAKPDEAFFQIVNRRTHSAPTWFVDDMEINRLAAEKCVAWKTSASVDELITLIQI